MKKTISLILCLIMLLSMVACGNGAKNDSATGATADPTEAANQFMVGYSKVNITPDYSIPLRGYGNPLNRMSSGFIDYIYATCAAITDADGNTVVVFGIDLINAFEDIFLGYRQKIAEKLGIPVDNVHMSCSHMHAGCDMTVSHPSVERYIQDCEAWFLKAAEEAMADRKPATAMQYASTNTVGMNYIRRYLRSDGTPAGNKIEAFSDAPITQYETEVDNQLQLLKFVREDGKDIIMANFQMHPHRASSSSSKDITADIVGVFRTELENKLDVNVLYFTGSSGNVTHGTKIEDEIVKDFREHGKALAKYAIDMEGKYTDVALGPVRTISTEYTGDMDHHRDHLVDEAKQVIQWMNSGKTLAECKHYMKEHWITSLDSAKAIVNKAEWPETRTTGLWAFAVGDIAFAVVPFEMFSENGEFIKDNSPFTGTFVLTCANTHNTYLPSAQAFQNGGYEVDQSKFAPGTGEKVADEYVKLLNALKK